jgi:molybdopterin-guanine dinucleotide biosynthesis protein B
LSISTIKHAHHAFEIDRPGKDSFVHRQAGAREVLISGAERYALIRELRGAPEPELGELLQKLSPVDLVLVEGFKASKHPKIEVHRIANGKPLLFGEVPNIRLIASDRLALDVPVPVVDLDDIAAIADHILALAEDFAAGEA